MRTKGKGQKLDKYYRGIDRLMQVSHNDLHNLSTHDYDEAMKVIKNWLNDVVNYFPESDYEVKDRQNLLNQLRHLIKEGY